LCSAPGGERGAAKLLRGKLKAMLANKRPDLIAPAAAWDKPRQHQPLGPG
jgi:hypothetical protein